MVPGVIGVSFTVKLIGGFKIQWPFVKLLQKGFLFLHHDELQQQNVNQNIFIHK